MAKEKQAKSSLTFDEFIHREFGGVISKGDEYVDRPREIIPTILSLDVGLSGGIPEGKIVLFTGQPKGGKTTGCLTFGRNATLQGRKFFFGDVEDRLDPTLIRTIRGLDPKLVNIIKSTKDRILTAEDWFNIIERGLKDHPRSFWVIDSIAMLSTLAEQSEATGRSHDMAGVPKLMASFLRKVKDIVSINNCTVVFVSQLQTNRDPTSRRKYDEKGGMGVQYGCSIWLSLGWVQQWPKDESGEIHGQNLHITIKASALGKPYRPCVLPLRFGEGLDEATDVLTHAENLGLVEKSGAWYSFPMFDNQKFCGQEATRAFLAQNPEALAKLDRAVREIVLPETVKTDDGQTPERPDGEDPPGELPKRKKRQ